MSGVREINKDIILIERQIIVNAGSGGGLMRGIDNGGALMTSGGGIGGGDLAKRGPYFQFWRELDIGTDRMRDYNDRLARYIIKSGELRIDNKRLEEENEALKRRQNRPTDRRAIHEAFEERRQQLRDELDRIRKENDDYINNEGNLKSDYTNLEKEYNDLNDELDSKQNELQMSRDELADKVAQIDSHDSRVTTYRFKQELAKALVRKLQAELTTARDSLHSEQNAHLNAEHEKFTREESLEFMRYIYDLEMNEARQIPSDSSDAQREAWKAQMASQLSEIRTMYNERVKGLRTELDCQYELRVQQASTGTNRDIMELERKREESVKQQEQLATLRTKRDGSMSMLEPLQNELARLKEEASEAESYYMSTKSQHEEMLARWREAKAKLEREMSSASSSKSKLEAQIDEYRRLLDMLGYKRQVKKEVVQDESWNIGVDVASKQEMVSREVTETVQVTESASSSSSSMFRRTSSSARTAQYN